MMVYESSDAGDSWMEQFINDIARLIPDFDLNTFRSGDASWDGLESRVFGIVSFLENTRQARVAVDSYLSKVTKGVRVRCWMFKPIDASPPFPPFYCVRTLYKFYYPPRNARELLERLEDKDSVIKRIVELDPIITAVENVAELFVCLMPDQFEFEDLECYFLGGKETIKSEPAIEKILNDMSLAISNDDSCIILLKLAVINQLKVRRSVVESLCKVMDGKLAQNISSQVEIAYHNAMRDLARQSEISSKRKSPYFDEVTRIINNTVRVVPNASTNSLTQKIIHFYKDKDKCVMGKPPVEGTIKGWIKDTGHKPSGKTTNDYDLVTD